MDDHDPTLTLFYHPLSSSLPALLLLAHLKIPRTLIPMTSDGLGLYTPVDPANTRDDFFALNPLGQVPTLVLDYKLPGQVVITQLPAVLHYIASLRDDHGMLGRSSSEQAQVQEWLSYISATFTSTGFTYMFRPIRVVGQAAFEDVLQALRHSGYEIVVAGLYHVEAKLDKSGFAVGGHLTVVELLLWTVWGWAVKAGLEVKMGELPKLKRVVEGLEQVDGIREVLMRDKASAQRRV